MQLNSHHGWLLKTTLLLDMKHQISSVDKLHHQVQTLLKREATQEDKSYVPMITVRYNTEYKHPHLPSPIPPPPPPTHTHRYTASQRIRHHPVWYRLKQTHGMCGCMHFHSSDSHFEPAEGEEHLEVYCQQIPQSNDR